MRYYSSVASSKVLDSPVSNVATSMTLNNVTGLPITYPYTLVIEPDTGNEEIVLVIGGSGSVLTIVRGANTDNGVVGGDGTSARAHDAGVVVKHMVTARDLQEPQNHMNSGTLVHGLGAGEGAVVGVDKTQTLTNKTLTSPALNGTPTAPTASAGTNTTQVATTAFVQTAISAFPAYAEAYAAANENTSGDVNVSFTTEYFDNTNMHSTSTNSELFTPTVAGVYLLIGHIEYTNNSGSGKSAEVKVFKNTTATSFRTTVPNSDISNIPFSLVGNMNGTTDYFKIMNKNSGSSAVSYKVWVTIIRLGA